MKRSDFDELFALNLNPGRRYSAVVAMVAGLAVGTANAQPVIIDLGTLPGAASSSAAAISRDGMTVVGHSDGRAFRWTATEGMQGIGALPRARNSFAEFVSVHGMVIAGDSDDSGSLRAFRWTPDRGMQDLGLLNPFTTSTWARAMSSDGSTLVGGGTHNGGYSAFRWTASEGMRPLYFTRPTSHSIATGVSDDGSVVVGLVAYSDNSYYAYPFRWTARDGMQDLPGGPGQALGVSADGSVVVGQSGDRAFRWTASQGRKDLGTLPGFTKFVADAVSGDGTTVVGTCWTSTGSFADSRDFVWTASKGMQRLDLPGYSGLAAHAISADGSAVVGVCWASGAPDHAFLWTPALGTIDLNSYLPSVGVDLAGWELSAANGVSPDGASIVGEGKFRGLTRAFLIADIPLSPCLADFDKNFFVNGDDFDAFAIAYELGAAEADIDDSGFVNGDDFDTFLPAFEAGC